MTLSVLKRRSVRLGTKLLRDSHAFTGRAFALGLVTLGGCGAQEQEPKEPNATGAVSQSIGGQGTLRVSDSVLAPNGSSWVSFSSGVKCPGSTPNCATSTATFKACDSNNSVWTKRFAHVPIRVGPSPSALGECFDGDAMNAGPGSWAVSSVNGASTVTSPAVARFPSRWALAYSAVDSASNRRCIGIGTNTTSPIGPNWSPPTGTTGRIHCPSTTGASATDPSFFYDRRVSPDSSSPIMHTDKWYLLWRETKSSSGCDSVLKIQEISSSTFLLVGSARTLLDSTAPTLGFVKYTDSACSSTGSIRRVIERPSMTRLHEGTLALFFSGNNRASTNYATGFALCGTASPVAGAACAPANVFDPNIYRPWWGSPNRTSTPSGSDASPYVPFPGDLPGYGGVTLALADATAPGYQPIYASAHSWDGGGLTQSVLRLDNLSTPALRETAAMTWHGMGSTLGNNATASQTPSGNPLSARAAGSAAAPFDWPLGRSGVFNTLAADGTLFIAGDFQGGFGTARDMVVGMYDPRTSNWRNVNILTTLGRTTLASPSGIPELSGANIMDVQAIDGGNAIAFTAMGGYPGPWAGKGAPPDGIWPTFGILTKVNGQWQVASSPNDWKNQWTGGQLRATNGAVSESACPRDLEFAPAPIPESNCRGVNEMAEFPRSKHLIVSQYFEDDNSPGNGGLMALSYTKDPAKPGRFTVKVTAHWIYPRIPDPTTADLTDFYKVSPKEVQTDPSPDRNADAADHEYFSLAFDLFPAIDRRDGGIEPIAVVQEFRYTAPTGTATAGLIEPISAPFFPGGRAHADRTKPCDTTLTNPSMCHGYGSAAYDAQGNLWAMGDRLGVYTKAEGRAFANCPWTNDGNVTTPDPSRGVSVWGVVCQPTYDIMQGPPIGRGNFPTAQLSPDRSSNTMMLTNVWGPDVLPIRFTGSERSMAFTTGNVMTSGFAAIGTNGLGFTPNSRGLDQRPPAFDVFGTMWWSLKEGALFDAADNPLRLQDMRNWVGATDVNQLFVPQPIILKTSASTPTTVQAEVTTPATAQKSGVNGCTVTTAGCTVLVDTTANVRPCTDGFCINGYELAAPSGAAFLNRSATYKLWAPKNGTYRITYRIKGTGSLVATVNSVSSGPLTVNTGGAYVDLNGTATLQMNKGVNTLVFTSPTSPGWYLDWFKLTFVPPP